ncbi:hypothetical protein AZE42_13582, partial [Rhizopogon vesiculosus]
SDHASEDNWKPPTVFDSLKFVVNDGESDIESDAEDITHSDGPLDDSSCCSRLIDFATFIGDDPSDETWLPPMQAKRLAQRKARPIRYKKGPDVGSKSVRTQRRYKELLQNQKSLTSLGFTVLPKLNQSALITPAAKDSESSPSTPCQDPEPDLESEGNTSDDAGTITPVSTAPPVADSQLSAGLARGVEEAWEEELEEQERSGVNIRSWDELRTQAYLLPGQRILQKKGKGRIVYVFGFIDVVDGRLALRNEEVEAIEEARKIIYPGANSSDAWWDNSYSHR